MSASILAFVGTLVLALAPVLLGWVWEAYGLDLATWLVREWVRLYTSGLPPALRDRRRAELASDLWEQRQADAAAGYAPKAIAVRVLGRGLTGIPQDASWRVEQGHLLPFGHLWNMLGRRRRGRGAGQTDGRIRRVDLSGHQVAPSGRLDVVVIPAPATARAAALSAAVIVTAAGSVSPPPADQPRSPPD